MGVRVQKGDATGYAFVQDLSFDEMKRAAETAANIANEGGHDAPIELSDLRLPHRYDLDHYSTDAPSDDKKSLLERASKAAHAFDPNILRAEASFAEGVREILVATSDGRMYFDVLVNMRRLACPNLLLITVDMLSPTYGRI